MSPAPLSRAGSWSGSVSESGIVDTEQLQQITGLRRAADIRRRLEKQGIACFDGKDGPWTTLELIKVAGMVKMGLIPRDAESKRQWL